MKITDNRGVYWECPRGTIAKVLIKNNHRHNSAVICALQFRKTEFRFWFTADDVSLWMPIPRLKTHYRLSIPAKLEPCHVPTI